MNIPDRIYAQYRDKPKAVAWYAIAKRLGGSIEDAAEAVRKSYDIDNVFGEQLNVIGRIVVAPRSFVGAFPMNPGLFDLTDGDEFGDDGAMFSALTIDQYGQLSDDLYRLVIKAKIIKNNGDTTIENILDGMNFLLPHADVLRVTDGEDMSFSIEFYGQITDLERFALLNAGLVPKPQSVRFNGFLEGFGMVEFGDMDAEFGDEDAEFAGYIGA
ncbi:MULTISPECIES: DUF2612 domain-containing protein [unclassified Pseudomonas]|jgi:hypothetical protein|uniref:DUF2612 domain-containing protein n=1 Tax=unclassified Pseudomonas TaxID=196821 RepID=UPI000C88DE1A|nr:MULTISPECIES: DUF2612 domain-containing protein [unclassified Pseudomonas]MBL1311287.1 DUF2612 domain-containing protein [Pseudomonas sp.]PMX19088.1 hypothetical protein C1Y25_00340 [Pseudomonas sp. MPBC4-3]PMX50049.1 hypothetical protein C1Y20_04055 [Pseudomonas sp. FW301-21B01]PMY10765.1 hypothetical protein C1Y18_01885 [Pseudomonas sp. MPR-R5A]PNA72932.1 hypothetical protein C1Y14_01440 [Pseudomonas sp. MPR-R5B]